MDSDRPGRSDDELTPDSTLNGCTSASYGGAVFSGCKKFTVAGGTFTNITKNITNSLDTPSDFRMVPLGDIDLQREIQLDSDSGIVDSRKERGSVRRVYSAKITGRKSRVTVAVYEGEGGAEEWRQHVAKYMSVRHPHIIQICGAAASSGGIHATLFYNELILFDHFLDRYRYSPILTVYIYKSCTTQYSEAFQYLSTLYRHLWQPSKLTIWVRQSSGHLSVDLVPSGTPLPRFALDLADKNFQRIPFLNKPNREAEAISLLTLDQYHEICVIQYRFLNFISHARKTVSVGALIAIPCQQAQDMVPIATLPHTLSPGRWKFAQDVEEQGVVLGDGWTR
ncbi:hypothetical protein DFH06DRAFT_1415359 [Mycena polygramma]|nr:hypothetical protein DFH06DRAFT_1415359 [Mycena polygramma]